MNEAYLGPQSDQKYIVTYLENIRQLDPIEIVTLPNPIRLADAPHISEIVDINRFWEIVNGCIAECKRHYSVTIYPPKTDRCYIARPPEIDALGGFHDPRSLGYQYWYHASFVVTLNEWWVSKNLRTVELVRNFLHDCFHHSTFRSFRRAIRIPTKSPSVAKHRVPEVYREQYGINFRNQDGLSYSSPELTLHSPETINLNLLMDGVIVLVVAELMKTVIGDITAYTSGHEEKEVTKEIFLEPFDASILTRAHYLYKSVTEPTRKFVEHWGGKSLTTLVLKAMMSGKLTDLKHLFEERNNSKHAWEKMFKRPEFSLPMNPEV